MSGLYQRALKYIEAQRKLRLVRPDELSDEQAPGVSPDDREKILSQINEIVEKNRIEIKPDTFDFRPKRRGGVLPLFFNLAALVIIAAGGFWLVTYFDRSEESIVTSRAGFQSAEGKLLAALKQESEQQLGEKEKAIVDIQNRLQQMNIERDQIEANAEAKIREREAALQAAMAQQIENERARLTGEGISESDISKRLKVFETEQQARFDEKLLAVRAEAQNEIDFQRATLNKLTSEYEQALSIAEQEKSSLQDEWTRQEATLLAEFQQKEANLMSDRLKAVRELETIRAQQERQKLVLDQILSFYDSVRLQLAAGSLDNALVRLNELKTYLNQADVISLKGVSERRQVELFLIGSLESLIAEQKNASSPDTQSLIRSAETLAAASKLIDQGNTKYLAADYAGAKELYISALTRIPAINVGYQRLKEMQENVSRNQAGEISAAMERANAAYVSGEYSRAVLLYGQALDLMAPGTGETITGQLTKAGFNLNREGDLSTIRNLQELVARQAADLQILETLRAERDAEITALKAQAADNAVVIATIEVLKADAVSDRNELERLRSQLSSDKAIVENQKNRIAFLDAEIARLTAKTEEDARTLLSMNSREQSRLELKNDLNLLKHRYLSEAADSSEPDLLSVLQLLETKLALRRIVTAEPVKSQYPDLYENIENSIDSLIKSHELEARVSTLNALNQLLDTALAGRGSIDGNLPVQFEDLSERDAFLGLISRLMKLLD